MSPSVIKPADPLTAQCISALTSYAALARIAQRGELVPVVLASEHHMRALVALAALGVPIEGMG